MNKKRLTKREREALGPQLSDMPQELPLSVQGAALNTLRYLVDTGCLRVDIASMYHKVPASIRGKWRVFENNVELVGTLRQWTYRHLVEKAVREAMRWQ